jgi:hypothetical protein
MQMKMMSRRFSAAILVVILLLFPRLAASFELATKSFSLNVHPVMPMTTLWCSVEPMTQVNLMTMITQKYLLENAAK